MAEFMYAQVTNVILAIISIANYIDAPPSSLLDPKMVQLCQIAEEEGTWCRSQLPALKGVRGVCWKLQD